MAKSFFITGTDTDVGKTQFAAAMLLAAQQQGLKTAAVKPIAAGCEQSEEGLRNQDALILQAHMTQELDYAQVNPVALREAIAPHIAAQRAQRRIECSRLVGFCRGVMMTAGADVVLIEGAGGWRVPINSVHTMADVAKELGIPVILVVGMRLGCINHALLSAEAIRRDRLPLAGWVANCVEPKMPACDENIATLQRLIPAPLLACIPHLAAPCASDIVPFINLDTLFNA